MTSLRTSLACGILLAVTLTAGSKDDSKATGPETDRVGFPAGYREKFAVLRDFNREPKQQRITIYGNEPAASVSVATQLPYPQGSVLVMETASALKDAEGKPLLDAQGLYQRGEVTGLHVMRRDKDFGAAYGPHRTAEWEYVEYRADGSFITPPQKSSTCAECHVKAGAERDFVYRGRFPEREKK